MTKFILKAKYQDSQNVEIGNWLACYSILLNAIKKEAAVSFVDSRMFSYQTYSYQMLSYQMFSYHGCSATKTLRYQRLSATKTFSYHKINFHVFLYCTACQHPAQNASTQRHGQPAPMNIYEGLA